GKESTLVRSDAVENEDLSQVKVPTAEEVRSLIAKDTKSAGGSNVVYVNIQHLATQQQGTSDLHVVRFGIAKALNSVSLNPQIVRLNPIEESRTVYRVS